MEWGYLGALDQDGVRFHLWSARDDEGRDVFALTRTSLIPPQRPRIYRSLEEIAAKNKFRLAPSTEKPLPKIAPPPEPDKPHGLFVRPGGWVEVNFLHSISPLPKNLYGKSGYWPKYEMLPTQEEYEDAKAAEGNSIRSDE